MMQSLRSLYAFLMLAPLPSGSMEVIVIHTEITATLEAVKLAEDLANGLDPVIHLIIPEVVPYPLPLECPSVPPEFFRRYIQSAMRNAGCRATIQVLLCRDPAEGVLTVLDPSSTVVFSAPTRWAWWTGGKRLARNLRKHGHEVIVAPP